MSNTLVKIQKKGDFLNGEIGRVKEIFTCRAEGCSKVLIQPISPIFKGMVREFSLEQILFGDF
jgi:hypothetical protein